jgi:hypothetical protein
MAAITWGNYLSALPRAVSNPTLNGFKYCFSKPIETFLETLKHYDRMPLRATRLLEDITRANKLITGMTLFTRLYQLYQYFYLIRADLRKSKTSTYYWNCISLTKCPLLLGDTIWNCLDYLHDTQMISFSSVCERRLNVFGTITCGLSFGLGLIEDIRAVWKIFGDFNRNDAVKLALNLTANASGLALAYLFSSYVGKDCCKTAKIFAKIGLFASLSIMTARDAIHAQAEADLNATAELEEIDVDALFEEEVDSGAHYVEHREQHYVEHHVDTPEAESNKKEETEEG